MAEEKKEPWLNYVALTTIILAVCATLPTFKGGQFSTRSVMSQSQASDQWAYYQAKSIKAYLYEGRKEALEFQLQTERPGPEMSAELQRRIAHYEGQIKRYEQEKAEISAKAKALEQASDQAQQNSGVFGLAVGAVGLVYFANGFLVFF